MAWIDLRARTWMYLGADVSSMPDGAIQMAFNALYDKAVIEDRIRTRAAHKPLIYQAAEILRILFGGFHLTELYAEDIARKMVLALFADEGSLIAFCEDQTAEWGNPLVGLIIGVVQEAILG